MDQISEATKKQCEDIKIDIIEIIENMQRVYAKHLQDKEIVKDG